MEKTSSSSFLLLLSSFLLIALHVISMNINTDETSLLALKSHITNLDSDHILSTNWSSSTSVCNWIGITCGSRHQRVIGLHISDMNISGTIPPQLGNLSFLVFLDLSLNNFHGELPPEFSHLRRLREIDLSYNNFTGEIPIGIATLPRLKGLSLAFNELLNGTNALSIFNISTLEYLDLGNAGLTGDFPSDLCRRVPRLKSLGLDSNMLSGRIPRTISECSELQLLWLKQNNFVGEIPREVGKLQLLEELHLSENKLQGTIPDEIGHLYSLKKLFIGKNELTGSIPLTIFNISSLEWLVMNANKLEGSLAREIGNLTMLTLLHLSDNDLTGVIPYEVGNLKYLTDVAFSRNNLSGSIPIGIFNISSLESFTIIDNHISGDLPSTIGHGLPNVELILLSGNNINGILPSSISNFSKLQFLELARNELTGSIPESLGNLRLLKNLNLYGNSFTGDLTFITPLANSKNLTRLLLSFNPLNAMLPKSIGNLSSLQYFEATGCNLKGHLPNEVGNMRNLSTLVLDGNDFTGTVPMTISSLKNLQRLSLGRNRISGHFPTVLCELPNLGMLTLSQNQMWGNIPSCLGTVTSLREVYLDSNNFSASIPSSLWNLKDILKLNLSSNFFNGSLPLEIGNLKAAILLDLSRNHISGNIPSTLGGLQKLIQLSLAHNRIEGFIPETFGKLIELNALDLSNNNMSGVIPKSLEALKQLDSFNVSFNRLHGEIPNGGPFVNLSYQSFMSNEGLCGNPQKHVPACPSISKNQSKSKKRRLIWIIVASSVISVIGLASAIVFVLMRRRGKTINADDEWSPEVTPQRISYYELQRATQGFDANNLLGSGSFGSVYKGALADGMIVAVKVFNVQMEGTFQTFDRECEIFRNLRHRNLTKIISSCCNLDFKALILEYMPNKSLDKLLYSLDYCLSIMQRLNIMVDVASALEYLHHGYSVPVIHCDLKPSNVLLDKDMVGHLTDFGIAKLLTKEESIAHTTTFATIGYIAPEYGLEGLISKRSDVYSYGIMLLETFTKKKPNDEMFTGDMNLRSFVHNSLPDELDQIIDVDLLTVDEQNLSQKLQCVSSIMELAMNCTSNIPVERMNMADVVAALEKIKQKLSSCY
ncbi:LRR receptor-like serine/threonine-protein kinase EFR [Solanum dulcamara]|uniref:LRR receptor-like serine/threonine-protein kinase EFR n=1 Tax=Solanum dulcamara TaxID=45834 RepID=UPI00248597F5|nr:LRR receptor-like serine/threonine-protein kinase EFR [Solanum dulcamara]